MESFIYGIAGFVCFECLRIYRNVQLRGKKYSSVIIGGPIAYVFLILSVGGVCGLIANLFSGENIYRALYIGFTLPTSASAIISKPISQKADSLHIEDLQIEENSRKDSSFKHILNLLRSYFYI